MPDLTSHSILRVILTIVGLNSLVLVSWLALTSMIGLRATPSLGPLGGALAGADWTNSLLLASLRLAVPIVLTAVLVAVGKRIGRP